MIIGMGIDAVDIDRMRRLMTKEGFINRYFHPQEIADAQKRGVHAAASFAVRFAAKEAYGKALGTGLRGITLKNILVRNDFYGKPELHLFHDALLLFQQKHGRQIHLSLTHEKNIAIACIILEGEFLC